MRTAFVVAWPHEWFRFETIRRRMESGIYLLAPVPTDDNRPASKRLLDRLGLPYVDLEEANLEEFDAIVESWYWGIDSLYPRRAKRIRVMYGYANKNNGTYDIWNTNYDLVLTLGPFATERMSPFAPCREVGNPRFDDFADELVTSPKFSERRALRDGILYLPTATYPKMKHHNFGSTDYYIRYLSELGRSRKVMVKLHPDVITCDPGMYEMMRRVPNIEFLDPEMDTMAYLTRSSVVVSDVSGVIFEAMAFGIPVILTCSSQARPLQNRCMFSLDPAEDRNIYKGLGKINTDPSRLPEDIETILAEPWKEPSLLEVFYHREHLDGRAGQRAVEGINAAVAGEIGRSHTQRHLKDLWGSRTPLDDLKHAVQLSVGMELPNCFTRSFNEIKRKSVYGIFWAESLTVKDACKQYRFLARHRGTVGSDYVRLVVEIWLGVKWFKPVRQFIARLYKMFSGLPTAAVTAPTSSEGKIMVIGEDGNEIKADAGSRIPMEDGRAKKVLIDHLLGNGAPRRAILNEAFRVTRTGGAICITDGKDVEGDLNLWLLENSLRVERWERHPDYPFVTIKVLKQ